jgi:hypothetical protein
MAVNRGQHEYFCAACGGSITEEEFEDGKAIRRDDKAYCRRCFRKEFPDECEFHPGERLSVVCAICKRMYCKNCVIEIAGKLVCSRCKNWALGKLADGEELEPDSSLFPDFEEIRDKRQNDAFKRAREAGLKPGKSDVIRDRVLFSQWDPLILFWVGLTLVGVSGGAIYLAIGGVGALLTIAAIVVLLLVVSLTISKAAGADSLRTVQVDDWGVTGTTFRGRRKQIAWSEVTHVVINLPHSSPSKGGVLGVVQVNARKRNLTIGNVFPRFMFIADAVRDICQEKDIKYEDNAV